MGLALPLIGLAVGAAGTGLQIAGNEETQGAENKAVQDELNTQQQFASKGKGIFQQSVAQSGSDVANQQIQQGTGSQLAKYAMAQGQPTGVPSSVSSDPITQAASDAVVGQQNQAQAVESGLGDYGFQQGIKNQGVNRALNINAADARAWQSTLGPTLQQASQAGAPLGLAGSGLGMLGQLAGLYSIYNQLPGLSGLASSTGFSNLGGSQGGSVG